MPHPNQMKVRQVFS